MAIIDEKPAKELHIINVTGKNKNLMLLYTSTFFADQLHAQQGKSMNKV